MDSHCVLDFTCPQPRFLIDASLLVNLRYPILVLCTVYLHFFLEFYKEKRSDVNAKYNACEGEYRFQCWKKKLDLLQRETKVRGKLKL